MSADPTAIRKTLSRDLLESLIRIGLVVLLVIVCLRVVAPFANLALWAVILAVAIYPLYGRIVARMKGRRGLAATTLVLGCLLLLGTPSVILGSSLAGHLQEGYERVQSGELHLPPPGPKVATIPLIGKPVYAAWNDAATNLPAFVKKHEQLIRSHSRKALGMAAGIAAAIGLFLAAIIVAGVLMAYGEGCTRAAERIMVRLSGPVRGPKLQKLSTATIRSVALGVVGVAFIQSLLLGMGFWLAGIPVPGVLALITMLLGILQLPALIVSLPAVAYLWLSGDGDSTTFKVAFSVYFIIAGLADNVLKPLLLGRGVETPMLVVLIGAIGGMVTSGIIGLFIGAVMLSVGYELFKEWLSETADADAMGTPNATPGATPADGPA